jgi:energy-coupling factor transporter ATP-binding protein EcfA2
VPPAKPTPLREMRFGQLDASQEAVEDPELLLAGFYDYREAAYGIAGGRIWLLLGPKGAGKSAVLEHLKLSWRDRYDRFFDYWDLRSFPVNDVTQIQTGQSPGAARAQAAWEFLLLLRIVDSLAKDEGLVAPGVFYAVKSDLVKSGLLAGDWRTKVVEWSKATAKFNLQVAELGVEFSNTPASPLQVTAILKKLISRVETSSRHLIALDGLDSFFLKRKTNGCRSQGCCTPSMR